MKRDQTTTEKNGRTDLFGAENNREENWILRLFIALLACAVMVGVLHAIGQVPFIAHICA